jgi:Trk K+ transport system NAD-binding subunit
VRVKRDYWHIIVTIKHPVMAGRKAEVVAALVSPDEIRRSKSDQSVYLFCRSRRNRRWVCAVSKQEGDTGFLITAHPTDAIKEGERILVFS